MKLHSEKISRNIFFMLLLLELIFILFIWGSKHQDISFSDVPLEKLNHQWFYIDTNGKEQRITLPSKLKPVDGKYITISRQLPKEMDSNTILATLSSYRSINAYIDSKLFYSYTVDTTPLDMTPGAIWNIINLPKNASGKVLTLKIISEEKSKADIINEFYIGTKSSLFIHIIRSQGIGLLISAIILFIGCNLLAAYLSLRKSLQSNKYILYLGIFSILLSMWMIMENDIIQFFISNRDLISTIKYLCLMTMPIPLLTYLSRLDHYHFKRHIQFFRNIFIGYVAIMLLLQALNLAMFHDGLIILHVLMILVFSFAFVTLLLDLFLYKNKNIRYSAISVGILFIFSMLEIITYDARIHMLTGTFMQFGILIFMLTASFRAIDKSVEINRLSERAKYYEYLATRDYMTKCKNRTAYSNEMDSISLDQEIAIVMADINNMKQINDTFGHYAGDEVIILCSQCLIKVLGNDNDCYRIGGDEFVCVEYNQSRETIENKLQMFLEECAKVNASCPYPFKVSIGIAFYDSTIDHTIYDTVRRADSSMYDMK